MDTVGRSQFASFPGGFAGMGGPREGGTAAGTICGNILFGVLLFFFSLFLMFWNEGSAVAVSTSLDEGLRNVKPLQFDKLTDSIARAHEGKLVHLTGPIQVSDVSDSTFGIKVNAIRLRRNVQMFQCIEKKTTQDRQVRDDYGKTENRALTEYHYYGEWSNEIHNQRTYAYPERCNAVGDKPNPSSFTYEPKVFVSQDVRVGVFHVSDAVHSQIVSSTQISPSDPHVLGLPADTPRADAETAIAKRLPTGLEVEGTEIRTARKGPPKIGDVIIRFEATYPATYSFVAGVVNGVLVPYKTHVKDRTIALISPGTVTAQQMFEEAQATNSFLTWCVRGIGWFLLFVGILMVLSPISTILEQIPLLGGFLGSVASLGITLLAFVFSVVLATVTICLAWLWHRPVVSISIMVIVVSAAYFFLYSNQTKRRTEPSARPDPSVPSERGSHHDD